MPLIDALDIGMARSDAEGEMVDQCVIRAGLPSKVFDPATGEYVNVEAALIYPESGRPVGFCKRQAFSRRFEQNAEVGAHSVTESRIQLDLPVSAPRIPTGAMVTMTACPFDPNSVGQVFRVEGPAGKTWATAQRINVSEVVG